MTDKQIIIDGFDLEYIKELLYNGQRSAITTNIFEEIIENLERKEQECEALGQAYLETNELLQEKTKECTNLKAENDELKYKAEFFENYNNAHINKITKLEKILTEIKDIAEKHAPRCNDNANCDYECEECHLSDLKQILQKISEVMPNEKT